MLENNIKEILQEQERSILNLSKTIGLTYASAHDLVNRKDLSTTKASTLVKTAKALDVNVDDLYTVTNL